MIGVLLAGCAGEEQPSQKKNSADAAADAHVPDACELADRAFLTSLLGDQIGSPRPEGDKTSERRGCSWRAPSDQNPKASFIIQVAGEGLKGMTDKEARVAHTREIYGRHTLQGQGGCRYFQVSNYRACWFLHRLTLSISILKEDLIITILLSSPQHRGLKGEKSLESARKLAGNFIDRL
jgi:hypothetical protein